MKRKLLLLMVFLGAFSSQVFAQATATQNVTTTLNEVRTITVNGGAITVPIKRSLDGLTTYTDSSATMVVEHDLLINQKVVAFANNLTGNWTNRNLWVWAQDNGGDAYWGAYGAIATFALILNGTAQSSGTFLGNLPITPVGGPGPLTLYYSGGAGLTAVVGGATAEVTYNITDQ